MHRDARACTCRHDRERMCATRHVCVGHSCAAYVRVYRCTRVRYVFSNSESQAGSSNLHIYSFTVIQSSLKLAWTRVSARLFCRCTPRTHAASSSLIHNSSKGLMELQSSRHSPTIFFFALLFPVFRRTGVCSFLTKHFDEPHSIIDFDNISRIQADTIVPDLCCWINLH